MSVLTVSALNKDYIVKPFMRAPMAIQALRDVSFSVEQGETLAVVGESGCGKSTLAKILMQLEQPTAGELHCAGRNLSALSVTERAQYVQMIFQDPYGSLNPRKRVWQIIAEPLMIRDKIGKEEARRLAQAMMEKVGLRAAYADRYPHMFSGGQRQRIGIARALMLKPKILICDEPISALDVSIQAQILNLLTELQKEFQLTYIFISHDLSVVRHFADRVMVIYLGRVVELGTYQDVFNDPKHPYTKALLASSPTLDKKPQEFQVLGGEMPSRLNPPRGCVFETRCPLADERCRQQMPPTKVVANTQVACWRV